MSDLSSLESLFFNALEKEHASERVLYLDSACAGDAEVRRQVEKLLRAHTGVQGFLKRPAVEQFAARLKRCDATEGLDGPTDGRNIEDTVLELLQPSNRSEALGRIGHYEILEVLGYGGFGIVFRAIDEKLQRVVAVKVLDPEIAASLPARKRFLREAQASAAIRHKNVVCVYAIEESPTPYLAMEYIPGQTLQQWLDERGPLDVPTVVRIGRQIAEGLAAAHDRGLIHRDIKPGNILLEIGSNDQVKISDFGVVCSADSIATQHEALAGTPMFMAPEQAMGETLDHRADLFSFGSVLYTMCCGRAPFRGKTTFAVLRRVVEDAPQPIREIAPETPHWLCEIITRLHAKNPADRFATAREVADLLGHHLAQLEHPANAPAFSDATAATEKVALPTKAPEATPLLRTRKRRASSAGRRWVNAWVVILVLCGGLGFSEATGITDCRSAVIRFIFPEGTLVVEVDDPGVSIQVDGVDLVITGAGAREIRLKPGSYTVEARKDGQLVSRELISVTNNGRQVVRVRQEAAQHKPNAPELITDATAWERSVATLPAEQQVQAVIARLKELNPGFDGTYQDHRWPEYELFLESPHLRDISPVRAMPGLKNLYLKGAGVTDLSPLRGLELNILNLSYTGVTDLSPLQDLKLIRLDLSGSAKVEDLSPLADTSIEHLTIAYTQVSDLTPLRSLKLKDLNCDSCKVSDLSPLKGMPLASLKIHNTNVFDLSPLRGMPLTTLNCSNSSVSDASLAHLKDCKGLQHVRLLKTKVTGAGIEELRNALPSCQIEWDGGVVEPQ